MVNLLLDQVRVKKLSEQRHMRQVLLELRVLRGRREEKLRRPGAGLLQRLDDRHQNFQELMQ